MYYIHIKYIHINILYIHLTPYLYIQINTGVSQVAAIKVALHLIAIITLKIYHNI